MSASFSIFNVHRVEISAHSSCLSDGNRMHYQRLELFNSEGWKIGDVILHLEQPMAALAIGDCSELDGFQTPALPAPTPRLMNQASGF
jgi:hypothetical protein